MNRFLILSAAAALLLGSTGCLHHHARGGLRQCEPDTCEPADGCESCSAKGGGKGLLGKLACPPSGRDGLFADRHGRHHHGNLFGGSGIGCKHCGPHAHGGGHAHGGVHAANMAYPYYTIRSPRDFLMDNPPTIGY